MARVSMRMVSSLLSGIPPLFVSLAQSISGEMDCGNLALQEHGRDGSPLQIRPQAIIYPKNASDIKEVLSFCREYAMPLTVCGNRTARTGGALGEGLIIDMTRHFTHIRQINMMEHTITVDAGVSVKSLREKLRGWHMDIPVLTAADETSTIGALVATKSATPSSFHHGTIREWVEALTVVVDTGEEHRIADGTNPSGRLLGIYQNVFPILTAHGATLRATKPDMADDATGYCIWNTSIGPRQLLDQLVGSEGTLGIITTITLRLVPYKPFASTTCIPINDSALLQSHIAIAKHHRAEHMFLYDKNFADLTHKYHDNVLPEINARYVLMVTHYDTDKERLHAHVHTYKRALPGDPDSSVTLEGDMLAERIMAGSFLFSLYHAYAGESHLPITTGDGIVVPHAFYADTLQACEDYLASTGKMYTLTGYAGSGHISSVALFDPHSPTYEQELDRYNAALSTVVARHKGGLSAINGDGLMRTSLFPCVYDEDVLQIFKKIKEAWDPKGVLNPLKKFGATTDYIHKHLARV